MGEKVGLGISHDNSQIDLKVHQELRISMPVAEARKLAMRILLKCDEATGDPFDK